MLNSRRKDSSPPAATADATDRQFRRSIGLDEDAGDERPSIMRIARLFMARKRLVFVLLGVVVIQAVAGIASPFFVREIIDKALRHRDVSLLSYLAGGMIAAAVVSSGMAVLATWLSNTIGQATMNDVRVSVFGHLQRMSLAFFTHTRNGAVQSRIANDIGSVDTIVINVISASVQSATTTIAITTAIFVLSWKLALYSLAIIPFYLLFTYGLGRKRRGIVRSRQRRLANLTALIDESLSVAGVLLTKTMGRQDEQLRRFGEESRNISDLEVQAAMAGRWRTASRRLSLTVIPAVVYWVAGFAYAHGNSGISIGTVVAATSMLNRLVAPASTLQSIGVSVSTSLAIFSRIFAVLDLPVDIAERPNARRLQATSGRVVLEDVWFRYPHTGTTDPPWAIAGVDLEIPGGSTTAIVGATGSGKTTLAYLVARLYEPDSGTVCIDGMDVRDATFASLAETIGFVSQETYLLHASIEENLRFAAPSATEEEIVAAAKAARIHETIRKLPQGYETVVGERGYRFSGGERQRLAITRLLLRNPPVIVLDEATSALDNATEQVVQQALAELCAGRTTIAIAHRLSTVRDADQVVVLDDGHLVERGRPDDLLTAGGAFAQLHDAGNALH